MTQPHHGSSRTEVDDLRSIVDRLDLLMGGTGPRSGRRGTSPRDEAFAALGERLDALEGEVDELRALVDHLMTIATWQAKVTAALVDDRDDDSAPTGSGPRREWENGEPPRVAHGRSGEGDGRLMRDRPAGGPPTLDDDIDDILGSERGATRRTQAPPDFGI